MLLNSVMTNSITSVTLGMMVMVVNAVLMIGTNDEVSQHTVKCNKIKNILQKKSCQKNLSTLCGVTVSGILSWAGRAGSGM